jgi:hypothetical protein
MPGPDSELLFWAPSTLREGLIMRLSQGNWLKQKSTLHSSSMGNYGLSAKDEPEF